MVVRILFDCQELRGKQNLSEETILLIKVMFLLAKHLDDSVYDENLNVTLKSKLNLLIEKSKHFKDSNCYYKMVEEILKLIDGIFELLNV